MSWPDTKIEHVDPPPPTRGPHAVPDEDPNAREHPDPGAAGWPRFQLDRNRILHCSAFRRLQYKTQVFVNDVGDHFRTRLTHTLEVAQLATRLARDLGANAELAEVIALAHDLGHPPFGHGGESALRQRMREFGGFEHNRHGVRVLEYLEHPYPDFRGLNLCREVREGIARHTSPYDHPEPGHSAETRSATLEAQIADVADLIAYNSHDLEDGLGAGIIEGPLLRELLLWADAAAPIHTRFPNANVHAVRRPIIEAIQHRLIEDVVATTRLRIRDAGIGSVDSVRASARLVGFSETVSAAVRQMETFLQKRVYRHRSVVRMDRAAARTVKAVFDAYVDEPALLPGRYVRRIDETGPHRVVCDYVAGMTDRYCQDETRKLCKPSPVM